MSKLKAGKKSERTSDPSGRSGNGLPSTYKWARGHTGSGSGSGNVSEHGLGIDLFLI